MNSAQGGGASLQAPPPASAPPRGSIWMIPVCRRILLPILRMVLLKSVPSPANDVSAAEIPNPAFAFPALAGAALAAQIQSLKSDFASVGAVSNCLGSPTAQHRRPRNPQCIYAKLYLATLRESLANFNYSECQGNDSLFPAGSAIQVAWMISRS